MAAESVQLSGRRLEGGILGITIASRALDLAEALVLVGSRLNGSHGVAEAVIEPGAHLDDEREEKHGYDLGNRRVEGKVGTLADICQKRDGGCHGYTGRGRETPLRQADPNVAVGAGKRNTDLETARQHGAERMPCRGVERCLWIGYRAPRLYQG